MSDTMECSATLFNCLLPLLQNFNEKMDRDKPLEFGIMLKKGFLENCYMTGVGRTY